MNTPVPSKHTLPKTFVLRSHSIVLRSLRTEDREAMVAFARSLPPNDLLFLWQDITQPAEVDRWIRAIDEDGLITLVAWEGPAIVGYATFDRSRAQWMRHVAEIRVVVGESNRGMGVGRLLLELAFEMAIEAGVAKVVARMTPDQTQAIELFRRLGFVHEATLHGHAIGVHGCTHDLLVYSYFARDHQDQRCAVCSIFVLAPLSLSGAIRCATCYHLEYQELGGGD